MIETGESKLDGMNNKGEADKSWNEYNLERQEQGIWKSGIT